MSRGLTVATALVAIEILQRVQELREATPPEAEEESRRWSESVESTAWNAGALLALAAPALVREYQHLLTVQQKQAELVQSATSRAGHLESELLQLQSTRRRDRERLLQMTKQWAAEKGVQLCTMENPMPDARDVMGGRWWHLDAEEEEGPDPEIEYHVCRACGQRWKQELPN